MINIVDYTKYKVMHTLPNLLVMPFYHSIHIVVKGRPCCSRAHLLLKVIKMWYFISIWLKKSPEIGATS